MYTGYGSTNPHLTNNPFLPQTGQQFSSRFPDISESLTPDTTNDSTPALGTWVHGSMTGVGGGFLQQQQSMNYQQLPMQNGYGGSSQMGFGSGGMASGYVSPTGQNFPMSTPLRTQSYDNTFGQQFTAPHVSGSSYSYLTGQQVQPNSSYNPAQQQLQNNPGYIAQFDPYSAVSQGWDGVSSTNHTSKNLNSGTGVAQSLSTGSTLSTFSSTSTLSGNAFGPKGDSHPKDYIRTHKAEIEAWDNYAWKQLLNTFEAMKSAWEARKDELMARAKEVVAQGQAGMAYGGYYAQQVQQEAARLQQVCASRIVGGVMPKIMNSGIDLSLALFLSSSKKRRQTLVCFFKKKSNCFLLIHQRFPLKRFHCCISVPNAGSVSWV